MMFADDTENSEKTNSQNGMVTMSEDRFEENVLKFYEFFERDHEVNDYKEDIKTMINKDEKRLCVSVDDIRRFDKTRSLYNGLLKEPMDYIPAMEEALKKIVNTIGNANPDYQYHIGLEGSFGDHYVNPRTLAAKHLGRIICIEGIVTRCSLVRPKVVKSVHYCEATELFHMREYRDATTLGNAIPTPAIYPKTDERNNPLTTEFGFCTYRDHQTISIQEMPERAPAGQLPRPLDVILDDDLVDKAKPGDRVCITGVYRSVSKSASSMSATFRTVILANNIRLINHQVLEPEISDTDLLNFNRLSSREDIFDLLANSLAPSIYNTANMRYIKKAVLLQLLGGLEKNLSNGTHIRGDINVLMVGDPSTAKSQMLRFVYQIAPLAITTTGRGSSGVGLTAAVTTDKETGERRLEAGAMVLADRGIVCIDEFDKMSDNDRVAIHEVMEQQTVTIAKAGIHTTLNARCSVIAAANPAYGQYIDRRRPFENIALPDSLLSRFDLLFIVCDEIDEEYDRRISEHVLTMHRYLPPNVEEGAPVPETFNTSFSSGLLKALRQPDEQDDQEPFERFNSALHSGRTGSSSSVLKLSFVKKYLHYAKSKIKPILTEEATEYISATYADLRNKKLEEEQQRLEKTLPVTARMLETLIRLATAHAKSRLSPRVEKCDAQVAYELLEFILYKEVKRASTSNAGKRRKVAAQTRSAERADSGKESDDDAASQVNKSLAKMQIDADESDTAVDGNDVFDFDGSGKSSGANIRGTGIRRAVTSDSGGMLSDLIEPTSSSMLAQSSTGLNSEPLNEDNDENALHVSPQRLNLFKSQLHQFRERELDDTGLFSIERIREGVNSKLSTGDKFSIPETEAALRLMQDDNQVMITEDQQVAII